MWFPVVSGSGDDVSHGDVLELFCHREEHRFRQDELHLRALWCRALRADEENCVRQQCITAAQLKRRYSLDDGFIDHGDAAQRLPSPV
jgi:hypothetical protein